MRREIGRELTGENSAFDPRVDLEDESDYDECDRAWIAAEIARITKPVSSARTFIRC